MAILMEVVTWLTNFYVGSFPAILYTAWVIMALSDIARREDMADRARLGWATAVLFVPLVGPLAYLLLSDTRLSWGVRMLVTAGGALVYLAVSLLAGLVTGS